jgi:hypothetical protein
VPSPPDDPQRDLVYAMEKLHFAGHCRHVLPRKMIKRWVRRVCRTYRIPQPKLAIKEPTVRGRSAECDEVGVTLHPKWGCNGLTLLHELAHWIVFNRHPYATDHGPTFMRVYGELLDTMRLVPFAGFRAVCVRHGIKVA